MIRHKITQLLLHREKTGIRGTNVSDECARALIQQDKSENTVPSGENALQKWQPGSRLNFDAFEWASASSDSIRWGPK